MPIRAKRKRTAKKVSLPVEIDRLGITILEKIVEGLIDVIDRAEADADCEDGGDNEPDPEHDINAFCWAECPDDRNPARRTRRRVKRHENRAHK